MLDKRIFRSALLGAVMSSIICILINNKIDYNVLYKTIPSRLQIHTHIHRLHTPRDNY